jgi:hypothetical protein
MDNEYWVDSDVRCSNCKWDEGYKAHETPCNLCKYRKVVNGKIYKNGLNYYEKQSN